MSYSCAMAGVVVVTDSTSSLPLDAAQRAGVTVIPLQVVIDDVSRPEAPGGVTAQTVSAALRRGARVSTSRPAPEVFAGVYAALAAAGAEHVVSVHLSRRMSGTWEAATTAASTAPLPVTVLDADTLAMAAGFAALQGAEAARAGATANEVADVVRRRAAGATTYFYVHTLEHLRRGGRIGTAAALMGSALAMKPLLTITDGQVGPYERVRTTARALARLEELGLAAAGEAAGAGHQVDVAVHHLGDPDAAAGLMARLQGRWPELTEVVVCEMSAVIGVHTGPGTLGIVVSPRV